MVPGLRADLPAKDEITMPDGDCKEENVRLPLGLCLSKNLTELLHKLHSPSKNTIG